MDLFLGEGSLAFFCELLHESFWVGTDGVEKTQGKIDSWLLIPLPDSLKISDLVAHFEREATEGNVRSRPPFPKKFPETIGRFLHILRIAENMGTDTGVLTYAYSSYMNVCATLVKSGAVDIIRE